MTELGSISFGATGATTISLNNITGTPKGIQFLTGGKFGTNETANARQGFGAATNDGAGGVDYQFASAELVNNNGKFTRNYPGTDAFVILDGSSGNPAVRGDVTGFSAGTVSVNITNADSTFQIFFIVWD